MDRFLTPVLVRGGEGELLYVTGTQGSRVARTLGYHFWGFGVLVGAAFPGRPSQTRFALGCYGAPVGAFGAWGFAQ